MMKHMHQAIIIVMGLFSIKISGDFVEGDMQLTVRQRLQLYGTSSTTVRARNGLLWPTYRWPNRMLYYKISQTFSKNQVNLIRQAMHDIAINSCLHFSQADEKITAYVSIERSRPGCSSWVGWHGRPQRLNLGNGCMHKGIIQHELLHALGFYHQQSDPNRDNYVTIIHENIKPGTEHNFKKYTSDIVTDFGIGYDYDSILHYGAYDFSANGKPTILPRKQGISIGQRIAPSEKDFLKLNRMYGC